MNTSKVPDFELYDVTTRLAMMYKRILKYSKRQLFIKRKCLHTTNPRNLRTMAKQALAYEE